MPFLRPGDLPTVFFIRVFIAFSETILKFLIFSKKKQRNLIINELARSNETRMDPPYDSTNHMGYGREEEEQKLIHFKNTIAASVYVLEKAVSHLNPSILDRPVLTVRELFLQENNPKLDRELCKYYIETYERARFSREEFGLEDYLNFVEKFQSILEAFVIESKKRGNMENDGILRTEEEEEEEERERKPKQVGFSVGKDEEVEMVDLTISQKSSKRVHNMKMMKAKSVQMQSNVE